MVWADKSTYVQVDLSKYTLPTYMRIVTFKTAYYSFYLPVACGLVIGGRSSEEDLQVAKEICLQMGQYFQVTARPARFSTPLAATDYVAHFVAKLKLMS